MKDIKKIQEFFSKPLEEGKQLDNTDFTKVVKAVERTGHPVTVLLIPKFNEIEVITGMGAPDDMLRDLSDAVDSLGYGRNDIIIAADSSNLSRREYSDIFRVKGGHQDYFEESVNEAASVEAYTISRMLGTAQQSTQDFIDDNKIDVKKIESYIKNLSPAKKDIIKDIVNGSTDKRLSSIKKNLIKQVKESISEMDINDPVMMKMRAAKDKKPDFGKEYGDAVKVAYGGGKDAKKIAFLKKERAQLMRDMEQEAEPEGGPIADEYGSKLNRIDAAIAKLSGRKEMDYDTAVGKVNEYDVTMPSQEQVDKFFALTQNEIHYLNSKPVAGQEGTFNKMEVEPWDEYDLSNFNSLVRKAKQRGKSIDENDKASIIKDKIEKLRKLSNSGEIDGDEFLDKFNPLQKQLKAIDEATRQDLGMSSSVTKSRAKAELKNPGNDDSKVYGLDKDGKRVHIKSINDVDKFKKFELDADLNEAQSRVSMPRYVFDKSNPNFLNVYIDYDLGPGGSSIALGKETMTGQIRRESAAEAMKLAYEVAKDLEAEYNVEDIDIVDQENGKVRIFAVSDDFIKMNPNFGEETDYMKRRRETSDYMNESLNPEVSNAVNRFIKAMAKRYGYSEQDAVYAIMAALKQREFDGVNEDQSISLNEAIFAPTIATLAEKVIDQLKEEKPGLWANIRAKKARGEKPAHGNSDAHKTAVKAGKKINKLNEDEENQFAAELDGFADQLAAEIKDELDDHKEEIKKSDKELNEIVGVVGIIGYILLSNTVANMLSKFAKKQFAKRDWGKGEAAAKKIYDFTHKNEEAFKAPIRRIVGIFTKNEKKKTMISDILYAIVILLMAGQAGGNAVSYIKKAGYIKGGLYGLKAAVKGTEVATILKGVVADAVS